MYLETILKRFLTALPDQLILISDSVFMVILPGIIEAALLAFVLPMSMAADSVELKRGQDQIEIVIRGKPFSTFHFEADAGKPYLMPLRTPSGIVVTRAFPEGNSVSGLDPKAPSFEPHQRPLYFGHGNLDGLDFWQEPVFDRYYTDHGHQAYGHMRLKAIEQATEAADKATATVRARFSLSDPNERVVAEQTQSYTFQGNDRARIVDCEFVLYATAGPLAIGDTKEGTFGIRLAPELSAPHDHMLNSHGDRGEPSIWGKTADWVSYSGTISGRAVGIAVFDSPDSFRHPTTWHARAYGLLAANPFGAREFRRDRNQDGSWTVPEGESLRFRYRVVIWDGELSPGELDALYRRYAGEK